MTETRGLALRNPKLRELSSPNIFEATTQHNFHHGARCPAPPTLTNPRFTLELEFVSSLANPYYLSHLAVTYPNLLGISQADEDDDSASTPDAQAFAAYLAYLYSYWKTPEYSQFLTHPGPTLRALRLLQEDTFRRDIILPQVIEGLAGVNVFGNAAAAAEAEDAGVTENQEEQNGSKT